MNAVAVYEHRLAGTAITELDFFGGGAGKPGQQGAQNSTRDDESAGGDRSERRSAILFIRRQQALVDRWPAMLLRGLIQSDGCRVLNRVKGKDYPRYQFTNASEDIRRIFCDTCDAYGVRWRQSAYRTISVSRRPDVAKLDAVIGPKA